MSTHRTDLARAAKPYLLTVYAAGLLLANATGSKVMAVGPMLLSVGALAYPLTFILQDVVNELYGKQEARTFVKATALALLALVLFSLGTVGIDDALNPEMTSAYSMVFGGAPRIVFASLVAFLVGGLVDVHIFFRVRKRWPGSLLARKVCSTLVSQFVDSLLFVGVAFAGVLAPVELFVMGVSQYAVKQVVAVGGLPVTFALIGRLK